MPGRTVRIDCATDTCWSFLMIERDSRLPQYWLCPACEDHILEQQIEAQSLVHDARQHETQPPQEVMTHEG